MPPNPKRYKYPAIVDDPGFIAAKTNVERALHTVRKYLDMDVAFVSEFVGKSRIMRHVSSRSTNSPISAGDSIPLAEGYCRKIVAGELPQFIPNTADVPAAMEIPETLGIPIGSHLSVPLKLSDGRIYGTFCCFSFAAKPTLTERDMAMMKAFAEMVADQIDGEISGIRERVKIFERTEAALVSNQISMVYQPSYCLSDHRLLGAESLSRFTADPLRTPDVWFNEAGEVGLKTELELQAIENAIEGFWPALDAGVMHLAINSSPATILDPRLATALDDVRGDQIVLEITEHDYVSDYSPLMNALQPLRQRGVKVAIDDAGSGYASMRHILNTRPDIIKLDISLTNGIDTDSTQSALARALCEFGKQTGCSLVAEGIETAAQLAALRAIGVHAGQGYYLGRPMPFSEFGKLLPRLAMAS